MLEQSSALEARLTSLADASGAADMRQCGDDLVRQAQRVMRGRQQEVHDLRMELRRHTSDVGTERVLAEVEADRQKAWQQVTELEDEMNNLRLCLSLGKSLSQEDELKETLLARLDEAKEQQEVMQREFERLRKENFELSDRLLTAQRECKEALEERNVAVERTEKLESIVIALRKRIGSAVGKTLNPSASLSSLMSGINTATNSPASSSATASTGHGQQSVRSRLGSEESPRGPGTSSHRWARGSSPHLPAHAQTHPSPPNSPSFAEETEEDDPRHSRVPSRNTLTSSAGSTSELYRARSPPGVSSPEPIYATPEERSADQPPPKGRHAVNGGVANGDSSVESPYSQRPLASLMAAITPVGARPKASSEGSQRHYAVGTLSTLRPGPPVAPYSMTNPYSPVKAGQASHQDRYSVPNKLSALRNRSMTSGAITSTTPKSAAGSHTRHTQSMRNGEISLHYPPDSMAMSLPGTRSHHTRAQASRRAKV